MSGFKKGLSSLFWSAFQATRGYRLTEPWYQGVGSILSLHRVLPENRRSQIRANRELELTPDQLTAILSHFQRRKFEFVSMDAVPERIASKNGRFVSVTFDDGYLDNLTEALPIFRKFQVPMTVYVATSFPERTIVLWWYVLEMVLMKSDCLEIQIGGEKLSLIAHSKQEKEQAFDKAKLAFLAVPADETRNATEQLARDIGVDLRSVLQHSTMGWKELRQLAADPLVTIGAHTVNHPRLSALGSADVQREMQESKDRLEAELSQDIRHFAYPFGDRDSCGSREFALARELGFETGVTCRSANVHPAHRDHLLSLPRLTIDGLFSDTSELDRAVAGFHLLRARNFEPVVVD